MHARIFIRCCLLVGLPAVLAGAPQVTFVGKATRLIPRANLTRAERTQQLQQNDGVAENDRVRTAAGGRARLELADGSLINVGSASELVVHAPTGATTATTLELHYGRVRAWVAPRTGAGRLEVRVTSTDPAVTEEVILLPGEGTAVPTNRPPQPPRRWTQEEMQAGYEDTIIP